MSPRANQFEHTAIRASAGAGKTYQLTNRFIALLAAGESPDRVLATTFTRKAAGEILERILQRLAAAALDRDACAKLGDAIGRPNLAPKQACELVGRLARNLHRLHARTLDSFFARIARSFAFELDLPPEWQIVEESKDNSLRGEAIQAMLRDEDPRVLTELVRLISRGDAARSVAERIHRTVAALHGLFCETDRSAWEHIPRPARRTAEEIERAIVRLAELPMPTTKAGEPNKTWVNAREKNVESARAEDWETFLGSGIAQKIVLGEPAFSRIEITSDVRAAYEPLLAQARAVLVGRIADRCAASFRLLESFDKRYRRLQRSQHVLRFEDVTHAIARRTATQPFHDIYFRLDAEVCHLLLDEFQDTSLEQWEVVRPVAKEVTSHRDQSHTFFCVGDVKQAIYGWRGGVAEIFDAIDRELPGLKWEPLDESRRSSPRIIDVVNQVFARLGDNRALEKYREAATAWSAKFKEHKTARGELPGYVCLSVAPRANEDEEQFEKTLVFAASEIARIAKQALGRSVGVLVRKNKAIARLIYELRERGVHASEEGGNPLTDTPAVTVLLSLLKLADHPGDRVARFHVATSPLGPIVGLTRYDENSAAEKLATDVRQKLLHDGYGPTLWHWVEQLAAAGACDDRDLGRLGQFIELAHRAEADATLRPTDFVDYVTGTLVEDPVPASVRVMTIHKAKGLQFDVVVLPDLDGKLIGQTPPVVTGRPSPTDRVTILCPYVNDTIRELLPAELQRLFLEAENQSVRGELCVLYVALTRAIHAMHLIVAPTGEKAEKAGGLPATFAGILRGALIDDGRLEPEAVPYQHGEPDWHLVASAERSDHAPRDERGIASPEVCGPTAIVTRSVTATLVAPPPAHVVRGLSRESPSGLEGGERVDLRKRLRLTNAAALDRGSVFHAWFQLIEWLDDGQPDDATLREAALGVGVRCDNLEEMIAEFRRMLAEPEIRRVLSRPVATRGQSYEVWRERPFVIRWDDALLAGKFDRVVLTGDGSRVVRAEVLDFKTDLIPADDPGRMDELVKHYRPQLDAYRSAAARLAGLNASQVGARLLFVTIGAAKDL